MKGRLKNIFLLMLVGMFTISAEPIPPFELDIKSNFGAGFFAELGKVVNFLTGFDPYNLSSVKVDWTQPFFPYKDDPNENGWDLFFEPIAVDSTHETPPSLPSHHHFIHDQLCIHHWMAYNQHLPYRLNVNRILNKYIKIKQPILDEFANLYKQHLEGYYCIGVHVRWAVGANGISCEAPKGQPSLQSYISEINELMQKTQTSYPFKIFLATDSIEVIRFFKSYYPDEMLFFLPNAHRSPDRRQSHLIFENADYWTSHPWEFHQNKPKYRGGVEALLDCLLLSKCDIFLHSTSNVATFVTYFSPTIESIYLPKSEGTWPCRYGL